MKACKNCGGTFAGNYCSNCGAPANSEGQNIYDTLTKGGDIEEKIGYISTILKIVSSPVQNTLKIASSTAFDHKKFLLQSIAVEIAIGVISKVKTTNSFAAAILGTTGMFVLVFIQVFLTYYGLRFISRVYRSGSDYAKLICIDYIYT